MDATRRGFFGVLAGLPAMARAAVAGAMPANIAADLTDSPRFLFTRAILPSGLPGPWTRMYEGDLVPIGEPGQRVSIAMRELLESDSREAILRLTGQAAGAPPAALPYARPPLSAAERENLARFIEGLRAAEDDFDAPAPPAPRPNAALACAATARNARRARS